MAHIRTNHNGTFRADIRMKGISINKTFHSVDMARLWSDETESNIKAIRALSKVEIKCLSLGQVKTLGGIDLFKRVGSKNQDALSHMR